MVTVPGEKYPEITKLKIPKSKDLGDLNINYLNYSRIKSKTVNFFQDETHT